MTTKLNTEQSLKGEQITDDLEAADGMKEPEEQQTDVFVVVELGKEANGAGGQWEGTGLSRNVGRGDDVGYHQ